MMMILMVMINNVDQYDIDDYIHDYIDDNHDDYIDNNDDDYIDNDIDDNNDYNQ